MICPCPICRGAMRWFNGRFTCPVCGYDDTPKPKSQTNADRIRAMSDEQLAEYLANICYDLWAMFVADPKKMWLDWLRQELRE